jgi:hypothetical protein
MNTANRFGQFAGKAAVSLQNDVIRFSLAVLEARLTRQRGCCQALHLPEKPYICVAIQVEEFRRKYWN